MGERPVPLTVERLRQLVVNWRAESARQEAKGHPKAATIWRYCANDLALALRDDGTLR